jgi:myo-inositol-1(or 4)-monophosphatase
MAKAKSSASKSKTPASKAAPKRKPAPKTSTGTATARAKSSATSSTKTTDKAETKPPAVAIEESADAAPKKVLSASRPLPKDFLIGLAENIREHVAPVIQSMKGRDVVGKAASGDVTFKIDKVAEKALLQYLKDSKQPVAYYSEDSGYTTFTSGQPNHLLVIDPIDGTRAAKSGFEWCVVSVASTRVIERPTLADVDNACVVELTGGRTFYSERGKGARIYHDGRILKPRLSQNAEVELMTWALTVPARPAELIFPTAGKLIDLTTLKGGFFACNSTAFSLTRLLTGQLDAVVDIANRFYRDIPDIVTDQFINAGRGSVLGIAPYDIAASLLIAEEAGCIVTDAYGKSLQDVLLLDTAVTNQRSMIASSNAALHEFLLGFFEKRIRQYETLLQRGHGPRAGSPNNGGGDD